MLYLLCDALQGLVSGAVAERLGGVGALCCLGTGSKPPPLTVLYQMNLAPGAKAAVSTTQLGDLLAAAQVGEGRGRRHVHRAREGRGMANRGGRGRQRGGEPCCLAQFVVGSLSVCCNISSFQRVAWSRGP